MFINKIRHTLSFFFCICCLAHGAFAQGPNSWSWLNPYPQGNDLIDGYAFSQNTFIAVGKVSTILKTTDGGINWNIQSYAGGSSYDLYSVHFINASEGWAVGDAGYIIHTTDGGNTWVQQNSGSTQLLRSVFFTDAQYGWSVGVENTLCLTTDGGNTWSSPSTTLFGNLNAVYFTDNLNGWTVSTDIFVTSDGGSSWLSQQSSSNELLSIMFVDQNNGWAAGLFGDVLHTTDAGESWTFQYPDVVTYPDFYSAHFIDNVTGWLVTSAGDVYKTVDAGVNWSSPVPTGYDGPVSLSSICFANSFVGWFIGSDGRIFKSVNGGLGWSPISRGDRSDIFAVSVADCRNAYSVSKDYVSNSYGKVSKTTNEGLTWEISLLGPGFNYLGIHFTDSLTGYVVGDVESYGVIQKTNDGGSSWPDNRTYLFTNTSLKSVAFANNNIGTTVGDNIILTTSDGGNTWSEIRIGDLLKSVYYLNVEYGWAIGSALYQTTNGGSTWEVISSIQGTDVFFSSASVGWCVGPSGSINTTTDGGMNWLPQVSGTSSDLYSIKFLDSNNGWAVGYGGTICFTTDGGNQWNIEPSGTSKILTDVQFPPSPFGCKVWAVGEKGTILSIPTPVTTTIVSNDLVKGWNLVSLPVNVLDPAVDAQYPSASSNAYEYRGSYVATESLHLGVGSWLKFGQTQVTDLGGYPIMLDTIDLVKGWNIIGSISEPVDTVDINTIPAGLVSSKFYGYRGSYVAADTIVPGRGYWVKSSAIGKMILSNSHTWIFPKTRTNEYSAYSKIIITDAQGFSQTLFLSDQGSESGDYASAELPPVPPAGIFDVRFASQRFAEFYTQENTSDKHQIIQIHSAAYPVTLRWQPSVQLNRNFLIEDRMEGKLLSKTELQQQNIISIADSRVTELVLSSGNQSDNIPREYILSQNYPNPFNPSTRIAYQLPAASRVVLKVFNILGQEVAVLVNEVQSPGLHSVPFLGVNIASGVYYYRLEARSTVSQLSTIQVKKMILAR